MASIEPPEDIDGADVTEAEQQPIDTPSSSDEEAQEQQKEVQKWPGWPGYSVFRIAVPVLKVGMIIGRKGELIKKLVEETRARIRVLDGPISSPDRIVLISGKEEPEAVLSPAMDAAIRIFKRINGLSETDGDASASGAAFCSIRFLVASTQAISLIGKQGSVIKSIQESSGASVRVLSNDEMPIYATSEERVVELQGEGLKVLTALEAVVGHLRKFLVDHGVLPLFEKNYSAAPAAQEKPMESLLHSAPQTSLGSEYHIPMKLDSFFLDRENQIDTLASSRFSLFGSDLGLGSRPSTLVRTGGPIVTQVAQTMQIPIAYAEDIIGVQGTNIEYIRRTSGAILTVQESRGLPDEITVEIKGTSAQVQAAQQLILEFTSGPRESITGGSLRPSSYPQLGSSSYAPSSLSGQSYGGGYGSSGVGGYGSFRP